MFRYIIIFITVMIINVAIHAKDTPVANNPIGANHTVMVYSAEVLSITDGDTFKANIDLGFGISIVKKVRLLGLDTPEKRTRNIEEKMRGEFATDDAIELLQGKTVILTLWRDDYSDSFGRALATVTLPDGRDYTTVMIDMCNIKF